MGKKLTKFSIFAAAVIATPLALIGLLRGAEKWREWRGFRERIRQLTRAKERGAAC